LPGLLTNKELNLAHRANLSLEEVGPEQVRGMMESEECRRLAELGDLTRVTAANVPGVQAINELSAWYKRQWMLSKILVRSRRNWPVPVVKAKRQYAVII